MNLEACAFPAICLSRTRGRRRRRRFIRDVGSFMAGDSPPAVEQLWQVAHLGAVPRAIFIGAMAVAQGHRRLGLQYRRLISQGCYRNKPQQNGYAKPLTKPALAGCHESILKLRRRKTDSAEGVKLLVSRAWAYWRAVPVPGKYRSTIDLGGRPREKPGRARARTKHR